MVTTWWKTVRDFGIYFWWQPEVPSTRDLWKRAQGHDARCARPNAVRCVRNGSLANSIDRPPPARVYPSEIFKTRLMISSNGNTIDCGNISVCKFISVPVVGNGSDAEPEDGFRFSILKCDRRLNCFVARSECHRYCEFCVLFRCRKTVKYLHGDSFTRALLLFFRIINATFAFFRAKLFFLFFYSDTHLLFFVFYLAVRCLPHKSLRRLGLMSGSSKNHRQFKLYVH